MKGGSKDPSELSEDPSSSDPGDATVDLFHLIKKYRRLPQLTRLNAIHTIGLLKKSNDITVTVRTI
jgi:hypothetical protein